MQLENIKIELLKDTEYTDSDNANIHHIDANVVESYKNCPICGEKLIQKKNVYRHVYDYCTGLDGEKHIYHIKLCSKCYICKNSKESHFIQEGMLLHKSPYTDRFKKYVIQLFLNHPNNSFSTIARKVNLSQPTVSRIIKEYAKEYNFQFCLPRSANVLYLHLFIYNGKERIYIAKENSDSSPQPLAFLGYDNIWDELERYLDYCLKYDYLGIYVKLDDSPHLQNFLSEHLISPFFIPSLYLLKRKTDAFLYKYKDSNMYFSLSDKIHHFLQNINSSLLPPDFIIENFFESIHLEERAIKNALLEYKGIIETDLNKIKSHHLRNGTIYPPDYSIDYTSFNNSIENYHAQRLPFEIMALRMMYESYGNYIFDVLEPNNLSRNNLPEPPQNYTEKLMNFLLSETVK